MPINAVCPECENRFQLQDDLLGQSMRCPKCKTVFTVKDSGQVQTIPATLAEPLPPVDAAPRTRSDSPTTQSRSGNISDFVPVLTGGTVPPKATVAPVQPREIKWSEINDPPKEKEKPKPAAKPVEQQWSPEMEIPTAQREPVSPSADPSPRPTLDVLPTQSTKRKRGFRILLALIAFVFVGLGTGGYFLFRYISLGPERTLAAAHGLYKEGRFDQARKLFEKLQRDYPSDQRVPEAHFFADLSGLRHEASSVLNRSDPKPALTAWKQLLTTLDDPALAPFGDKKRFGIDIAEGGTKLLEDVLGKAKDVFDRNKPDEAEEWLNEAAGIDTAIERFRPDEVGKPESIAREFATLRQQIAEAKASLVLLAEVKTMLADPDDDKMATARNFAAARGLAKDDRFLALLEQAEKQIQGKAVYTKQEPPIAPTTIPDDGLTSLLFAPSLVRGPRQALQGPPQVFFASARGVLYALSEMDGHVLWAMRTGLDCTITPVRVAANDQHGEMVLVASSLGGKHGLSARSPNDGRPLWHQALPAECQGPPVVFGTEAYVAINDPTGTILQINVATGELVGRLTVGRPLATAMALRPGSGLLYVPADARAVYVFDLDKRGPNAERLEPVFVGVMSTGHAPGTLRCPPVFANPDPEAAGPKYLVLCQVDGTDAMKLRVFPMQHHADGTLDNAGVATELTVQGWSNFAPYCDGETLAVVTDQGFFGLFGLGLAGNRDPALFTFPQPHARPARPTTVRGQIVHAVEGAYWVLARGQLLRLRFGINGEEGLRLVPYGEPIPVGDPLQPAQVSIDGSLLVVVTQDGQTCRATAFDAHSSEIRWRRELGLMVKGNPLSFGTTALFLDQAGGFYFVDAAKLAERGNATWLVDERWMLASPISGYTAVTDLIRGPNNSAIAVMLSGESGQRRFLLRRFNGTTVDEIQVPAPAPLAGTPVVIGDHVVLPLTNGTLYRVNFADPKGLEEGPSWRGERLSSASKCYLTAVSASEYIASDGARSLIRWGWPTGSKLFESRGRITLSEKIDRSPITLTGPPAQFMVGDSKGNVTLWDAVKFAPPAIRSWRPNAKGPLPVGSITQGLWLVRYNDSTATMYQVGSQLILLDPTANEPRWLSDTLPTLIDTPPVVVRDIYLSERSGRVRVLNMSSGKLTDDTFTLPPSYAFAAGAIPVGPTQLLIPLTDGTILVGQLKAPPPMK